MQGVDRRLSGDSRFAVPIDITLGRIRRVQRAFYKWEVWRGRVLAYCWGMAFCCVLRARTLVSDHAGGFGAVCVGSGWSAIAI